MAWTYANWPSQSTPALRLTRLNLHIEEVSQKVQQELGADGKSRGSSSVQNYLDTLFAERDKLEKRVERTTASDGASGMFSQVRFREVDRDGRVDRCE